MALRSFAEIVDDLVVRVLEGQNEQFTEDLGGDWVEVTHVDPRPSPGWSYDGSDFYPPPPETAPQVVVVTKHAFLRPWTVTELTDFFDVTKNNAEASVYWEWFFNMRSLDLSSDLMVSAKTLMVAENILTQARADELWRIG